MISGHSKFGLDKLAQPIASAFNMFDVFDSAILLWCVSSFFLPQVCDETNIYHWKRCTQDTFGAADNIMSYRQF